MSHKSDQKKLAMGDTIEDIILCKANNKEKLKQIATTFQKHGFEKIQYIAGRSKGYKLEEGQYIQSSVSGTVLFNIEGKIYGLRAIANPKYTKKYKGIYICDYNSKKGETEISTTNQHSIMEKVKHYFNIKHPYKVPIKQDSVIYNRLNQKEYSYYGYIEKLIQDGILVKKVQKSSRSGNEAICFTANGSEYIVGRYANKAQPDTIYLLDRNKEIYIKLINPNIMLNDIKHEEVKLQLESRYKQFYNADGTSISSYKQRAQALKPILNSNKTNKDNTNIMLDQISRSWFKGFENYYTNHKDEVQAVITKLEEIKYDNSIKITSILKSKRSSRLDVVLGGVGEMNQRIKHDALHILKNITRI